MVEVRGGKLRAHPVQPAISLAAPPGSRAGPSAAALAEEIASLRAEVAQRSSELVALVEDKVAAALDAAGPKLQAEMDWFSNSIASRMDEQQRWFEDYRISATQQLQRVDGSRSAAKANSPDAVPLDPREARLSQLEERLELLEHDSVLMLIEELRNDVRKQLRAGKKELRDEGHRFQRSLEKVQAQVQQQADSTASKVSALRIRIDEKISGTDAHMLRRTAELAAIIDELMEETGTVHDRRGPPQQPAHTHDSNSPHAEGSEAKPKRSLTPNDTRVEHLCEQVGRLSTELEKTRAEMQQMRDAFRGLAPESISSIVGLAGSVQDELRALRAEVGALEAVTHEALRAQESEIVSQRRDINSLGDELREVATALEHITRAQTQRDHEHAGRKP